MIIKNRYLNCILMTLSSIGLAPPQITLANPSEEEQSEGKPWHSSPTSNPQILTSDSDPRIGLLRMGFDLEEVAVMAPKAAREKIHIVHRFTQATKRSLNGFSQPGKYSLASSFSGQSGVNLPGSTVATAMPTHFTLQIVPPSSPGRVQGQSLRSLVSDLIGDMPVSEIWEILALTTPSESRESILKELTNLSGVFDEHEEKELEKLA